MKNYSLIEIRKFSNLKKKNYLLFFHVRVIERNHIKFKLNFYFILKI